MSPRDSHTAYSRRPHFPPQSSLAGLSFETFLSPRDPRPHDLPSVTLRCDSRSHTEQSVCLSPCRLFNYRPELPRSASCVLIFLLQCPSLCSCSSCLNKKENPTTRVTGEKAPKPSGQLSREKPFFARLSSVPVADPCPLTRNSNAKPRVSTF